MRTKNAIALVLSFALEFAAIGTLPAQRSATSAVATDPRWTPWLGCWQQDTAGFAAAGVPSSVTCVTPLAGSASVEALSIARGQIVSRKRLDATGAPHPIDETGCHGDETANWSPTNRRIYLRADYVCLSMRASSSSVFAMSPAGEWLEVQNVRADGGSINRVLRWHEAPSPRGLPKAAAASIASRRLSIATARAAASRPLGTDDVIEATRAVDAATVQSWILATGQRFSLDDTQLDALDRADVPLSIVRAMTTGEQATNGEGEDAYDAGTNVMTNPYSAYNGYDSYQPYNPYAGYGYGSYGAYGSARYGGYGSGRVPIVGYPVAPPIVIVRGGNHSRPVGRGAPPPRLHPPAGRPVGARPPAAKPPVTHVPSRARP